LLSRRRIAWQQLMSWQAAETRALYAQESVWNIPFFVRFFDIDTSQCHYTGD